MIILLWLIPWFLFAVSNFIDKYLLSKHWTWNNNIWTIILTSALINLLILPVLFIFSEWNSVILIDRFVLIFSGILYIVWLLPYLYALRSKDASFVTLYFQFIPLLNFIAWFFIFDEYPTVIQWIGISLSFLSILIISIDKKAKYKFSLKILLLMFSTSLCFSFVWVLFKFMNVWDYSFWGTTTWEYLWAWIVAVILLLISSVRRPLINIYKKSWISYFSINVFNELIYVIWMKIWQYAQIIWLIGVATLVSNSSQLVFSFILWIILSLLLPKIFKENISKFDIVKKIFAIILWITWMYLM